MLAAFVEPSSAPLEDVFGPLRPARSPIGGGRFQRCEQRAHGEQQTLQSRRRGGGAGLDKMRVCAAGDTTSHDANIASRLRMLKGAADRRERLFCEYVPIARSAERGREPLQVADDGRDRFCADQAPNEAQQRAQAAHADPSLMHEFAIDTRRDALRIGADLFQTIAAKMRQGRTDGNIRG
jgi:hypothetical protein